MKRPSFQFYPADWLSDMQLRMLPWASKGLYMDLLCYCWREGWIPSDSSAIAQLSGCHDSAIIQPCLKLFQVDPIDPSKLIHKRIQEEKNKQDQYSKERSESGKRGAKAKWNKEIQKENSSANGSATKEPIAKNGSSTSISSATSTTDNTKHISPKGDESEIGKSRKELNSDLSNKAETIYSYYPRKVGKTAAIKAIVLAMKYESYEKLLETVKTYAEKIAWKEPQFIPYPSTWFNEGRFNDDQSDWEKPSSGQKPDHRAAKKENEFQEKITIKQL